MRCYGGSIPLTSTTLGKTQERRSVERLSWCVFGYSAPRHVYLTLSKPLCKRSVRFHSLTSTTLKNTERAPIGALSVAGCLDGRRCGEAWHRAPERRTIEEKAIKAH